MGGMGRVEAERLVERVLYNVIDEGVRDMHHPVRWREFRLILHDAMTSVTGGLIRGGHRRRRGGRHSLAQTEKV